MFNVILESSMFFMQKLTG